MTQKMTQVTSHYAPQTDQNDQSMTHILRENYLVIMSQKMTKMTTHYAPKNDQNDQSMKDNEWSWWPKKWPKWPVDESMNDYPSGHDDPKNDQNDYSLWVIIGS